MAAGAGLRTLTAYYDLAIGPPSFDFVVFLVKAEIARRKCGAEHLHVVIVPKVGGVGGMFRDKTHLYDEHEMRWRLWHIAIAACPLAGASVTLATDWNQARRLRTDEIFPEDWDRQTLKRRAHLIGGVIEEAKRGTEIPRLAASAAARRAVAQAFGAGYVTMTQRSTYLAERNSDGAEWSLAAEYIEAAGCAVVRIPDTKDALAAGSGYGAIDLDLRMATYGAAGLNLQANNGAASLCWFSERPYRMFGAGVPADEWDGLFVKQGLPLGASWPWSKPQQKICYGRENAASIISEFEEWRTSGVG